MWKEQREISTIKVTRGTTFAEAKRIYAQNAASRQPRASFSTIAAPNVRPAVAVACTQIDVTWPRGSQEPSVQAVVYSTERLVAPRCAAACHTEAVLATPLSSPLFRPTSSSGSAASVLVPSDAPKLLQPLHHRPLALPTHRELLYHHPHLILLLSLLLLQ